MAFWFTLCLTVCWALHLWAHECVEVDGCYDKVRPCPCNIQICPDMCNIGCGVYSTAGETTRSSYLCLNSQNAVWDSAFVCTWVFFLMAYIATWVSEYVPWVHVNIYVTTRAYISLNLCLGFSVNLSVSLSKSLFFSNPVSHRVGTRDDVSEQLWDGKDEMSTEYTMRWRAIISVIQEYYRRLSLWVSVRQVCNSHTCWKRSTCVSVQTPR